VIVVDTSAIVAVLRREAGENRLRTRLQSTDAALISTANLLELQLVLAGRPSQIAWRQVEIVLEEYAIAPRVFDERQLGVAREAAVRFGKGRHKASLNFGDCFAYALAKVENVPLLCTGKDFAATDIAIA
jgi:ribonuclease VapC